MSVAQEAAVPSLRSSKGAGRGVGATGARRSKNGADAMTERRGGIPSRLVTVLMAALIGACATSVTLPRPRELRLPHARLDNTGQYLCPYTRSHTLAEWTDAAIRIKAKGQIAGAFGTIVGIAIGGDPIFGTMLKKASRESARQRALDALGGDSRIRSQSDVSFDSADDLAVYLYAFYSAEPTYVDALDAAMTIYPELVDRYVPAVQQARR